MGEQRDDPDMSDETRGQKGLGGVRGRDWGEETPGNDERYKIKDILFYVGLVNTETLAQ